MTTTDDVEAVVKELRLFNHHKAADLIEALVTEVGDLAREGGGW